MIIYCTYQNKKFKTEPKLYSCESVRSMNGYIRLLHIRMLYAQLKNNYEIKENKIKEKIYVAAYRF